MKRSRLSSDEISALRILVHDHLNTISDIACHCFGLGGCVGSDGYIDQLEAIEEKLKQMERGR